MSERQDAVITLYSVIKNDDLILEAFKKHLRILQLMCCMRIMP